MIAKFITASKGDKFSRGYMGRGLKYYFYSPFNFIHSRNWDSDRKYGEYDKYRDKLMGGGSSIIWQYVKDQFHCELSDFLGFVPFPGNNFACRGNGIHELTEAPYRGNLMGTPSSLGCLRLFNYQSKFVRWWTPMYSKLYIYLDEDRYFQINPK